MKDNSGKTNILPMILVGLGLIMVIGSVILLTNPLANDQELQDPLILAPIELDQPAPMLTLYDLEGAQVSISDFSGQVVLLNNWATWCPPCREEMPEFQTYYEKYKDAGFQILAVEAGQPEEEVRAFVDGLGLNFTILLDPENQSLITFQQSSLPNSFVIDRRGHIRLAWIGAINGPTLERYLTPILEEDK